MGIGDVNQRLLFALGGKALRETDGLAVYYSVQRRHPDGKRWVDLAHFASREDALAAIGSLAGQDTGDLRVKKVTRQVG